MPWIAHREFGADHLRFRFSEGKPRYDAPESMHYWLELWLEVASDMDNEYRLSSARSDERDMEQTLLREAREVYKNLRSLRETHRSLIEHCQRDNHPVIRLAG